VTLAVPLVIAATFTIAGAKFWHLAAAPWQIVLRTERRFRPVVFGVPAAKLLAHPALTMRTKRWPSRAAPGQQVREPRHGPGGNQPISAA
jgi:hypothetical protein